MIQNFIKSSFRSLLREKSNTIINILGLTMGITGSIVLFVFIMSGSNFDTFNKNHDRIYRVVSTGHDDSGVSFTQGVPTVMPEAFRNNFPDAEEVAFTSYQRNGVISVPDVDGTFKKFEEPSGIVFTEPSFFRIFDRKMTLGSNQSLARPNEAIISEKWALKYFGKKDVIGETIKMGANSYTISGVMEDYSTHTDLPFDLMLSYITIKSDLDTRGWGSISDADNCYFLLKENSSPGGIQGGLEAFAKTYYGEEASQKAFMLQPLETLHSDMRFGNYNRRMPQQAKIVFMLIGAFLLIACCINFINLTTATAVRRMKDLGIRRIMGSTRAQLISQMLGEAFMVTTVSFLISMACAHMVLGAMNSFLDSDASLLRETNLTFWVFAGALLLLVTILSGLYPAFVLSRANPLLTLRQNTSPGTSGYAVRRGLIITQFFISQVFIIATIVVVKQHLFLMNMDLGFASEAVVTVPLPEGDMAISKKETLQMEMSNLSTIEQTSLCSAPPFFRGVSSTGFQLDGNPGNFSTQFKAIDKDYLSLFHIPLIAGELFDDNREIAGAVVNETFVKTLGFKSNADIIGKDILLWDQHIPVKGVVKDFNTTALDKSIEPVIMMYQPDNFQTLAIKVNPKDIPSALKSIQAKWEAAFPDHIFKYEFVDEKVAGLYDNTRKLTIVLGLAAAVAVAIGSLGLFGLVTFMANQKTKEIGVRKVLGATVASIVFLFSKEFLKLITIGFIIAAPLAGLLMTKMLEEFAYKTTIGLDVFLVGLVVTFLIAFATVGIRSVRAAMGNPADSLRAE